MRQKLSKETEFTQIVEHINLIDMYRKFHLTDAEYTFYQYMVPSPGLIVLQATKQSLKFKINQNHAIHLFGVSQSKIGNQKSQSNLENMQIQGNWTIFC